MRSKSAITWHLPLSVHLESNWLAAFAVIIQPVRIRSKELCDWPWRSKYPYLIYLSCSYHSQYVVAQFRIPTICRMTHPQYTIFIQHTCHIYCIYIYTYTHIIHILYTQHTYIIYVILVENGVSPKLSLIAWLRPPVNHHEPSGFQCLQWLLSELCCLRPALSWQLHLAAANGSPNVFFKTWTMFKPMLGVFVGQFWGCFGGCFGDVLGNMSTVLGANLWLALFFWDVGPQSILKRFPQHRRASCNLPKPTPKKYLFHTKVAKTHHSICCP